MPSPKTYNIYDEKSVQDLIADLKNNTTPRTAVISWPGPDPEFVDQFVGQDWGSYDIGSAARRWTLSCGTLALSLGQATGTASTVGSALAQNTSLKTLMLFNGLVEFDFSSQDVSENWDAAVEDLTMDDYQEVQNYSFAYRRRAREVETMMEGIAKNKSLKVLYVTNWSVGDGFTSHALGAYDGWREMCAALALTLEVNTTVTLECLDLRHSFGTEEADYNFQDDRFVELSSGELVPMSKWEQKDEPWNPTGWSSWNPQNLRNHPEFSQAVDCIFAPSKLGNAIRQRSLMGRVTTSLKGVPLSLAWKQLGLPTPLGPTPTKIWIERHPGYVEPNTRARESGIVYTIDYKLCGNSAIIDRWVEEGRIRLGALASTWQRAISTMAAT